MVSSYGVGIMGSSTEYSRAQESGYQRVQNEFGSLPYNCVSLDRDIKRISDKLVEERKKSPLPSVEQKAYMEALELKKSGWEGMFGTKGCRDIIENIRLTTGAVESSKFAIKAEQQVLPKNEKDQNLYIGLGAVVMLIGLYIVLKE
jgi:hypothetical protein